MRSLRVRRWVFRTAGVAGVFGAFAALGEGRAAAQSSSEQAAAEALFSQARDLMAAKQYAEACPKFVESQRLDPAPGTLLNLATCYERNGQIASAWVTYKEAAISARKADQAERARLARDKAAELEPKLPMLTIVVPVSADRPDLEVRRDGAVVGRPEWGVPIPVDPGAHQVDAAEPGHKAWQGKATVGGAGAKESIEIPPLEAQAPETPALPTAGAPGPTPAPAPSAALGTVPPPAPPAGGVQRTAGIVVGAVGLGVAVLGGVFGVVAISDKSTADGACLDAGNSLVCSTNGYNAARDAKAMSTVSTIGLIAGGTLFATGLLVFFTAPSSKAPGAGWIAPLVGDHAAGARAGVAW
jgi:hypothetical protein